MTFYLSDLSVFSEVLVSLNQMSTQNTTTTLTPPLSEEERQRLNIGYIVTNFYFSVVFFSSCSGLLAFYYAMRRVKFKMSNQLTIHIFLWFFCGICTFVYMATNFLSLTTCKFCFFKSSKKFNAVCT
jgi:hypothetical protein